METLKKLALSVLFAFTLSVSYGQNGNYETMRQAFKTSYEKEAFEKWQDAIDALEAVYVSDSYECNLRLGWLYYNAGNQNESKTHYQKAVELKPFAIEAKFGLIYPIYAMGNLQEVIRLYDEIITIAPNNTQALYQLGSVYFYQKQYEKASNYFSKVVDLFPFSYDALIMLAHTNFHLKKFREARVLYNKVLLYNPDDEVALESLALLD
ncbi:tetratricopeptide repeat protein [Saccharicrinis sp. 156]|uniref:tetratricopeptide repeat protein n=1 Tax=Saccharicrinis sp. 156 TaxID=3417574 RepID=UPI003D35981C